MTLKTYGRFNDFIELPTVQAYCNYFAQKMSDVPNMQSVKLAHNTYVYKQVNNDMNYHAINIVYHNTEIVTYYINSGTMTLRNGGYTTVTTKARLNMFSPASVYQRDFQWYIQHNNECYEMNNYDTITLGNSWMK